MLPNESETGETLTSGQAAARLGPTKGWVNRLVTDARLPAIRRSTPLGDYWEIQASDLTLVRGLKHTGRPRKQRKRTWCKCY